MTRPDHQALEAENHRLRAVIERDRAQVAQQLGVLKTVLDGYAWLSEGRGPYAVDDDLLQQEVARMLSDVRAALAPLQRIGTDRSDPLDTWADVQAARQTPGGAALPRAPEH